MATVPKTTVPERKAPISISTAKAIPVTPDNFNRAETDMYFATAVEGADIGCGMWCE